MTEKTWNLSKNKWPSTENKEPELVQPVKMNIRQSNTYIKYCSWLQLYDDLRVHKRQKVLDEQSYIPVFVATDYQICTDGKLKNHVKKCEVHWLSSSITSVILTTKRCKYDTVLTKMRWKIFRLIFAWKIVLKSLENYVTFLQPHFHV